MREERLIYLVFINCIMGVICFSGSIYSLFQPWWKSIDESPEQYQSLLDYDQIGHTEAVESSKTLFLCAIIITFIFPGIIIKFYKHTSLLFISLLLFLNLIGMIYITVKVPLDSNNHQWIYQRGYLIGWVVVGIDILLIIINIVSLIIYNCIGPKKPENQYLIA